MRILVLGAGALGGYFGGRLVQAGADVTFLVRPERKALLAQNGLIIESPLGNFSAPVKTLLSEEITQPFDVVILSCKAYDLEASIAAVKPAMGPNSVILPVLNGMRHMDTLERHFGAHRVMGGLAFIVATLGDGGRILHMQPLCQLCFGELDGRETPRVKELSSLIAKAKFDARLSSCIIQEMWEKWTFLSTLAASTCLMRASIGAIMEAGGLEFMQALLNETRSVADACGHAQRTDAYNLALSLLTNKNSAMTASMLRDLEGGGRTEADHIIGDLIERGEGARLSLPLLSLAYTNLKAYEIRRDSEKAKS